MVILIYYSLYLPHDGDARRDAIQRRFDLCEIGILLPRNQRQHRTLHIQKHMLPYALC